MSFHRFVFLALCVQCSSPGFTGSPDAGGVDATTDGPILPSGDGSTDAGACTCSADLHQVICGGNVKTTCSDSQGCAGGTCIDACQASVQNGSTIGCEYYAVDPDAIIQGGCYAAFIANTWGSPVTIDVDRGGTALGNAADFVRIPSGSGANLTYGPLVNGQLPAGEVAIVFLAATASGPPVVATNVSCPAGVTPAYTNSDAALSGSTRGVAFHITTDRPVAAYDVYPYGGGISAIASGTLLLPTAAWTTNYLGIDSMSQTLDGTPRWLEIVGTQDGTTVTILPTADIAAGNGVAAAAKGTPTSYTVGKGEVLQLALESSGSQSIAGSAIQSDNPIGVWGGASALEVPTLQTSYADSGHQQLPPVKALGHDYVFARFRDRYTPVESPPVMLVGAVTGTTLTYDPSAPAGAPTTLTKGQAVLFAASAAFEVKSQDDQHPFYMSQFMEGCGVYAGGNEANDCRGDPEWVNTVPPQEYLTDYVFSTDPTYPETELVLVRPKGADVTLDCAGSITTGWQPVGSGAYEWNRVDLVTGDFQKVGSCDNGIHTMHGTAPFGVTVWGWGSAASGGPSSTTYSQATSYAFPAGMSLQPITTVVVTPEPN